MTEILDSLVSWPTLLFAVLIYGFAPGFLLRLLVLVYEKDDPRRGELIAELYDVPRLERPFWVAEQFETAIFDGVVPRVRWALTGRVIRRWKLRSGVKQNRLFPDTFSIPSKEERLSVGAGDVVKLMFLQSDGWGERMWVRICRVGRWRLVGHLENLPLDFPRLDVGARIVFRRHHIIDILEDPGPPPCPDCLYEARDRQMKALEAAAEARRTLEAPAVAMPPMSIRMTCGECGPHGHSHE
jgi:hypothetical protein